MVPFIPGTFPASEFGYIISGIISNGNFGLMVPRDRWASKIDLGVAQAQPLVDEAVVMCELISKESVQGEMHHG